MRVYFVGSHSTGKTTLSRYVSGRYNLPMITEVARKILSEKELQLDSIRHDIKQVNEYQKDIFYRQLHEEEGKDNFVSDRSFDGLAYAAQHTTVLTDLFYSPDLVTYLKTLHQPDTFIFFIRPSRATLKADGVREHLTWDGVVAIDSHVKFLLQLWQLRHFQISMDSMQERIQLVDAVLSLA